MLSLPPVGGTGKKVNGASLFGKDRYDQYVHELTAYGTIAGIRLTKNERKEAHRSRYSKIGFKRFTENLLGRKSAVSPSIAHSSIRMLPQYQQKRLRGRTQAFNSDLFTAPSIPEPGEGTQVKGGVGDKLDEIISEIRSENAADRADAKAAAKDAETKARENKEARKEAFKNFIVNPAKKAFKPITSFFNRLWSALGQLISAGVLIKLVEYFKDEENQKKALAMWRFVKDWWPGIVIGIVAINAVMAGIALWATGAALGALLTKLTGITLTLGALKWVAALLGLGKVGQWLGDLGKESVEAEAEGRTKAIDKLVEEGIDAGLASEMVDQIQMKGVDGPRYRPILRDSNMPGDTNVMPNASLFGADAGGGWKIGGRVGYNLGGLIPGRGPNKDSVPAFLTPGEFVMSRDAVDKWGANTLAGMNAAGGGTNRSTGGRYNAGGKVDKKARIKQLLEGPWSAAAGDELHSLGYNSHLINRWARRKQFEIDVANPGPGYTDAQGKFHSTPKNVLEDHREANKSVEVSPQTFTKIELPKPIKQTIYGTDLKGRAKSAEEIDREFDKVVPISKKKLSPTVVPIMKEMGSQSAPSSGSTSDGVTRVSSVDVTNGTLTVMNALYNIGSE